MKKRKKNKQSDRKAALKRRTESTSQNRSSGGGGGVLDISDHEDVNFYKPEKGDNIIDIVPFIVTQDWYPTLRSPKGKPINIPVGDPDYKLEVCVHRGIGAEERTVVCLQRCFGKRCPICEERKAADDPDVEKELKPTWRSIYNIKEPEGDDTIKIFDVSEYLFERELLEEATQGDDIVSFSDLEDGASIKFRAKQEKYQGNAFFKFKKFDFIERDEELNESILEDVYPLDAMLTILTYEQVNSIFLGEELDDDDNSNDDDSNDEPKPRKKRVSEIPDFLKDLDKNEIVECPECDRPIPEDAENCPYDDCDAEFEGSNEDGSSDDGDDSSSNDEIDFDPDNPVCPFGHDFGSDDGCMNHSECDDECPTEIFEACSNVDNDPEPKKKTRPKKKKVEDEPKKKKKKKKVKK